MTPVFGGAERTRTFLVFIAANEKLDAYPTPVHVLPYFVIFALATIYFGILSS
jgi:hypothetical protein